MKTVYGHELRDIGGMWLQAAREWIQWRCFNGSDVMWGSREALKPMMTAFSVEELASDVAAAVMTDNGILTKNSTPKERWEALRDGILKNIKEIDRDTPWQETEPKWWLEMREIEQKLMNQCNTNKVKHETL